MRVGKTRMTEQLPDEVRYYFPGRGVNEPLVTSVFPGGGQVPTNYGGFYLEAMDAHGGWVASTVDLLRFVTAVDARANRPDLLATSSIAAMIEAGAPVCAGGVCWYGLGWLVRPTGNDANWWHDGSLPGTTALIVRSYHNFAWAALFNARSDAATGNFGGELDATMWTALGRVNTFPTHDLFSAF
jgi:hypothetical protein